MSNSVPNTSARLLFYRLWTFIRPMRWILLVACLLATFKALGGLGLAAVSRWLLNHFQDLSSRELMFIYGAIGLFLVLLLITTYYRVYLPSYISNHVVKGMRHRLYRHLQRLSADFYAQHRTGEVVSRVTNDITLAQLLYSNVIINAIFDAITLSTATIYIIVTFPFMVFAPILGTCLAYGVLMGLFLPRMRIRSRQVQEEMGRITSEVSEKIVGMKVLQSFTHEEIAGNVVDDRLESHFSESLRMAKLQSLFAAIGQTLPEFAKLLVIALGIYLILRAELTVGDIAGMILVLGHVFFPLRRTASMTTEIGTSVGSMDRILEFFDAQPSVIESKEAIVLPQVEGRVEYRDVSFSYSRDGTQRVLRNISFEVKTGSYVAIVGSSGAGKSTMMDLLSRFYDPREGQICIDGVDIRTMSLEFLRKNIGIVMQDTVLFSGTIAENVRLGNPDASDHEVHEALANAHALEFVDKMQYGMNSSIAEQGKTLSGGQRQRIALARMFLKNPRIIILDEATSALDTESEQYVQQALQGLRTGRTTLMIAHHFATLKDVEYIYVVDQGRIVEEGSMNDLLMAKGVFHQLYESQSRMLAVEDVYRA